MPSVSHRIAQQYGALENWGQIEGLAILWDGNAKKVLHVIDTGVVPVPHPATNHDLASVGTLRDVPTPITVGELAKVELSFPD